MKYLRVLVAILLIVGFASVSWAIPMLNDDGSGNPIDQLADGTSYGYYRNSGDLLFVNDGNNLGSPANLAQVETLVEDAMDYSSDFVLSITPSMTWTNYNTDGTVATGASNTGTWETVPLVDAISFYAVKAGDFFAMYWVNPEEGTGSWSTYDIWKKAQDNNLTGAGGNDGLAVSHFTGYNPDAAPVPEPATMLLLGTGLVGLAGFGRKKIFRK